MSATFDTALSKKTKPARIKLVREWELLDGLKMLVEYLDYGCHFVAAECVCGIPPKCDQPANNILAWFKYVAEDDKTAISALHDDKLTTCGFWRAAGCCLPWQYRPVECIKYICPTKFAELDADFASGLPVLFAKMESLEDYIVVTEIGDKQWL